MIGFFSKWAEGIIIISVIGVIIEMILPEENNKKYIKMVIGVCVLFTVISPILSKIGKNSLEINSDIYEKYFENQVDNFNIVAKDNNINKIYEGNIKKSIETGLLNIGYSASDIKLKIDEKNSEKIEYIEMNIKKNKKIENVKKVNKVQIGEDSEDVENFEMNNEEKNRVKDFLNINYGIEKDKIFIN